MPPPTADQLAGLRAWFPGVRANVLDVVLPQFAALDSAPPLTAEVLQDLADAGAVAEFLALMETDVGVRGISLRVLCAYFSTAVSAARAGRPAGAAPGPGTVHRSMAEAALQAVRDNVGATDAVVVRAVEAVAQQQYEVGTAAREDSEGNGAFMEAMFRHGPGSGKLGSFVNGRGNGRGSDDVIVEENMSGGLTIVGKSYLSWVKDKVYFDDQWNAAYDRAHAEGMIGARDRILAVHRWLTAIGDWEGKKQMFLKIMERHHCKLPHRSYSDLLILQVAHRQGEIAALMHSAGSGAAASGQDGMDGREGQLKPAGVVEGMTGAAAKDDQGECLRLVKRAMGPAGAVNRLIEEVKGVAWSLRGLHDAQLPAEVVEKLLTAIAELQHSTSPSNADASLDSLSEAAHSPVEVALEEESKEEEGAVITKEAIPATSADLPPIHPILSARQRKRSQQAQAKARTRKAQAPGGAGR